MFILFWIVFAIVLTVFFGLLGLLPFLIVTGLAVLVSVMLIKISEWTRLR